jgi:mercuric ion transport protein
MDLEHCLNLNIILYRKLTMDIEQQTTKTNTPWLGVGAVFAAIAASACCVGPLLLLSLGIGGAWMSTLTSMEAVRPFFIIVTLLFIWGGFMKLYLNKDDCKASAVCATNPVIQKQRQIFWIGSCVILVLLAFPWYAPYFL